VRERCPYALGKIRKREYRKRAHSTNSSGRHILRGVIREKKKRILKIIALAGQMEGTNPRQQPVDKAGAYLKDTWKKETKTGSPDGLGPADQKNRR